jgi:hypothetical protein
VHHGLKIDVHAFLIYNNHILKGCMRAGFYLKKLNQLVGGTISDLNRTSDNNGLTLDDGDY